VLQDEVATTIARRALLTNLLTYERDTGRVAHERVRTLATRREPRLSASTLADTEGVTGSGQVSPTISPGQRAFAV
jgi:hypothetical protein